MKRPFRLLGLLSFLLLAYSCQNDGFEQLDRLEVTTQEDIKSPAEATEQIVGVETNYSKWVAVSKASWLTATPAGKNLVLQFEANPSLQSRSTEVVLTAGGMTKTLKVVQAGQANLVLEIEGVDGTLELTKIATQRRLMVRTNAEVWTVSSDADWLTAEAAPASAELMLRVSENATTSTRSGRLTFTAEGKTATLLVRQEGKLHFLLPYNEWGQDLEDIHALETERGSMRQSSPNPTNSIPYYTYRTQSVAFPTVRYEFMSYGDSFLYATALQAESPELVYSPEFRQWLSDQGFVRMTNASVTSGSIEYIHSGKRLKLYTYAHKLTNDAPANTGMVYIVPLYEQPSSQPALSSLDLGLSTFGTATLADVQQWESRNGGHYDAEFTSNLGLRFWFAEAPFYGRGYFFSEGAALADGSKPLLMSEKLYFYYDYTKFLYLYGSIAYPTNEFIELARRSGYILDRYDPVRRWYVFFNNNTGMAFLLRSFNLDKTYASLNIWKANTGSSRSGISLSDDLRTQAQQMLHDPRGIFTGTLR